MLVGIYSGAWYLGKGGELGKYKGSGGEIWEKNECWNKKARKVGQDRGKEL